MEEQVMVDESDVEETINQKMKQILETLIAKNMLISNKRDAIITLVIAFLRPYF